MMKLHKRKNLSKGDRLFVLINGIILFVFFAVELYPLLYAISASVSSPKAVSSGEMLLWPVEPSLSGYQYILQYSDIWTGYGNTVFYTVLGTLFNLFLTLPAAYALSRRDMRGRGLIMAVFMFTMYFSGGLIPAYLNVKSLGLFNTRWVIIIISGISVFNLIVARTFFETTIPWELHEAARIDGCNDFRIFLRIVLPLSAPIIVVMILYYGVGHWNSFFTAMIYLSDRKKFPLQLFLREILLMSKFMESALTEGSFSAEELTAMIKRTETADMIKYGVIIVSTAPMMAVYPWLQKYFAKGVMVGSVKG